MQIELSTVLGALSTVISIVVGAWFATARYALGQREKEIDRRLDDCRNESKSLNDRLHVEEKATIRQDGDLNRVRDANSSLVSDINEIKQSMVTKNEFNALERTLDKIHTELQRNRPGISGGYSAFSPSQKKTDPR